MSNYRAILIAGPTASGKSQLALDIAAKVDGVIINADSMQVYEDLSVLTARPPLADLAIVPHRLYGFVPGHQAYSVGRYVSDAEAAIAECADAGQVPILVGGTGLYFKALLDGLSPIPPIPLPIRNHWRAEANRLGPEQLHGLLANRDPKMAVRLQPTDPQRIVRALEVLDATGQSLAEWQRIPGVPVLPQAGTIRIVIDTPREELYGKCEQRLETMIADGALAEVAQLAAKNLDQSLPIMRALGVQPLISHLRRQIDLATAIEATKTETRNYIKRQLTWLNRNMMSWKRLNTKQMKSFSANIFPNIK